MIRIKTLVNSVVLLQLALGPATLARAEDKNKGGIDHQCSMLYSKDSNLDKNSQEYKDLAEDCKKYRNKSLNTMSSECDEEKKAFTKAASEFIGACNTAGITNKTNPNGNIGCAMALQQCGCRFKNPPPDLQCDSIDSGGDDDDSQNAPAAQIGGLKDLKAAEREFNYCPALAGKDLKDYEQKLKESQEKVKELEKKLPELQQAANEAMSQAEEKMQEIKKQNGEAAKEYTRAIRDAKRSHEAAVKALNDQIAQLQNQIASTDESIDQVELSKSDAELKKNETKKQIELNCHASASAQVAKLQAEQLELHKANRLNRGGFNSLLKNVGLSDREAWQRVANKYYRYCVESRPTLDSKDSANKMYESALVQADKTRNNLIKRKASIQKQILQIKDNKACGQGGSETQMCQAVRQAAEDMRQVGVEYEQKKQELAEAYQKAQVDGARNYQNKAQEAMLVQKNLAEERLRLQNLERFLALKNKMAGNTETDAKSFQEANSKHSTLNGAAVAYVVCKSQIHESDRPNEDKCAKDSTCVQARSY
ncbi:MAG: hypothetical protein HC902_12090, partial [Calothrix sp. SM1_5_4]|nr:hypothetical protein [Calothrix sp. SM1_5_4]